MHDLIIHTANIVNEGRRFTGSVIIEEGRIHDIIEGDTRAEAREHINGKGLLLIPGVIDDQVHFREPGLTHKADIWHESRAAAAGGVTSFMEMPNTNPQTTTQSNLRDKFETGRKKSLVNYSFYIGATNDNLEELLKTDPRSVCGVKIFMGSSTGNMLVDNPESLENMFSQITLPIAVHCEDENTILANTSLAREKYGEAVPFRHHPVIRSEEACYLSSSLAVNLAKKHNTRLHILHLSTGKELELLDSASDRKSKRITAEVCVHHLWFNDSDYERYGARIKWNPAIKTREDQEALMKGLKTGKIDVVATDHAPHTLSEKMGTYFKAPSGGPLVQHSLVAMLELHKNGLIAVEEVVDKMCHAPADIFSIPDRGYIRKGYWADLVLVNMNQNWSVTPENILSKCGWSPFEAVSFSSAVHTTIVNGCIVYNQGKIIENSAARELRFER
ncbi:MAG: dihydroorotase [Bacteroidales bacterium]|nr:dihydroorotase [Bacteroidales bacterium]